MKARSMLSGEDIEVSAAAKAPDPQTMIAQLQVKLATAETRLEAANATIAERDARIAALEQERTAVAPPSAPSITVTPQIEAPQIIVPTAPPCAYDVVVTKRDDEGRISRMSIAPKGSA